MNLRKSFACVVVSLVSLIAIAQQGPKPKPAPADAVRVVARVDLLNQFTYDPHVIPIFTPSTDSDAMYRMSIYVNAHCETLLNSESLYWRTWLEFYDQMGPGTTVPLVPIKKQLVTEPQTLPCRGRLDPDSEAASSAEPGFAQYTFRTVAGTTVKFTIYPIYVPDDPGNLTYDLHVVVEKL